MSKERPDLTRLLEQSLRRVAAMSPTEREAMMKAQRESWVRAFTQGCKHGVLDFEQCPECRALYAGGGNE